MRLLMLTLALALLCAAPALADELYVGTDTGAFLLYNTLTGDASQIGALHLGNQTVVPYGFSYIGTTIYMVDGQPAPNTNLYSVDTSSGALTLIGALGTTNGFSGIASQGNAPLYAMDFTNLYTVDAGTGHTTTVGPLGFPCCSNWGMSFAPDGHLYIDANSDGTDAYLYRIDLITGHGTRIGDATPGVNMLVSADGTFYAVDAGFGWYYVDTNTGFFTYIRDTPNEFGRFFAAAEALPTPEPASLLLMGTAVLGLARRFRRA
jgi:hypothetical protein